MSTCLTGGKIHSQSIVILNDHFYPMVSVYIKKWSLNGLMSKKYVKLSPDLNSAKHLLISVLVVSTIITKRPNQGTSVARLVFTSSFDL